MLAVTPWRRGNYAPADSEPDHAGRHHLRYTDKFSIGVVDLTKIDVATAEDKHYNIDEWAKLFKSETWEDIKMLAAQNVYISKAGETYFEITADEHERQLAEAREDVLRRERARKRREDALEQRISELEAEIARLKSGT